MMIIKKRIISSEITSYEEKSNQIWHFWSSRPAPSLRHSFNPFSKTNTILRPEPAPCPPALRSMSRHITKPIQLSPSLSIAKDIAKFWNEYYIIGDWRTHVTETDVLDILQAPGCIALGIKTQDGSLVGTILSTPMKGICMVVEKECELRRVEGLVLHPKYRGNGVAGWLLGWMDHLTSLSHPTTHVWFQESCKQKQTILPKSVIMPASREHIAQITLPKLVAVGAGEAISVSWSSVSPILQKLWESYNIVYHPTTEQQNITWWRSIIPGYESAAVLVGIAKTKRVRRIDSDRVQHLYTVVLACLVRVSPETDKMSEPFWNMPEDRLCEIVRNGIEAAAFTQKCDVLHVYSPSFTPHWKTRAWSILHQHRRKMYMYNRIPPSLGHSHILWSHCGI